MRIRMPSLVGRLTLVQALILTLSWGALLAAAVHVLTAQRSGHFDLNLELYAESLAEVCEGESESARVRTSLKRVQTIFDEAYFVLPEGTSSDYRSAWQVLDRSGRVVHRSPLAPSWPMTPGRDGFSEGQWGGQTWRIASASSESGGWVVHAAESLQGRRELLMGGVVKLVLGVFAFMLPVSLLLTWAASRAGLRPLLNLAREVHDRPAEDLRPLAFQTELAELVPLVEANQTLMDRLKRLLDGQQRFLSDAAHELRTPLAGAEVQLHALRHAPSPEAREVAADAIQAALTRAGFLVRQLLVLARLDAGEGHSAPRSLDLAELCRVLVGEAYPLAQRAGVELSMDGEGSFLVEGDPEALRSLVGNLLENAIRHGGSGGHVLLRLSMEAPDLCLEVLDDGPGIPLEARDQVWRRFYRLPGTTAPGSGLGMSIVQAVAERHGGRARLVEGLDGHGTGVQVTLRGWGEAPERGFQA